jgi:hypothetical protein
VTRPCLGPTPGVPCPTRTLVSTGIRCPACAATTQLRKDARRPLRRTAAETGRRRATVDTHVQDHGYRCPGSPWCGPAHDADPQANPLTADHVESVTAAMARGVSYAQAEAGPLVVLCRRGNSARGARTSPA